MRILAIGAHPDDVEFGCGAVLIKEIRRGHEVKTIVLSRGEAGSSGTPQVRENEARAAAGIMGAEIEFWDLGGDCRIVDGVEERMRMAAAIRTFRPQIVLAPETEENQHPDHAAAGRMAREACRFARYGGLLPELPVHRVAALYFYTITRHVGWSPDVVLDVGEVIGEWERAMRCHETQVRAKAYLDLQISAARVMGLTFGMEYAIGLKAVDAVRVDDLSDLRGAVRGF